MKHTGFSRDTVELKLETLSINYKEGKSYCSPCLHFVLLSALQTLLWWQNACGFLAAAVAKQNSSNSFKFRWLLVACLCGSSSLSFESKTLGGTSVSDLNQNGFLIGKFIAEVEKDVTRGKEKALFKQFNLYSSFSLVFLS